MKELYPAGATTESSAVKVMSADCTGNDSPIPDKYANPRQWNGASISIISMMYAS